MATPPERQTLLQRQQKKAAVKVSQHFTQEKSLGKGFIAFLEGFSEDVK
jgi:hypothetical protein